MEAFSLTKTDYPLVIVGKDGWLYNDVKDFLKNANKKKFKRIHYLPFSHLMMLLKSAKALIFPSVYEGFGLPVLEAMLMGCPVITSNTTSIPEIGGDAVSYIDPMDVNDIARRVDLISDDQKLCDQLIERGYVQSEKFSPENHYKKLIGVYNKCV